MSRPPRARGLKQLQCLTTSWQKPSRPPRARGLKRDRAKKHHEPVRSRPPRARGLKLQKGGSEMADHKSRPPRARGLKRYVSELIYIQLYVAPPAGAWIETCGARELRQPTRRRAPHGRVDCPLTSSGTESCPGW